MAVLDHRTNLVPVAALSVEIRSGFSHIVVVVFKNDIHVRAEHANRVVVFNVQVPSRVTDYDIVTSASINLVITFAANDHVAVLARPNLVVIRGTAHRHGLRRNQTVLVVTNIFVTRKRNIQIKMERGIVTRDKVLVMVAANGNVLFTVYTRNNLHGRNHRQIVAFLCAEVRINAFNRHVEIRGFNIAEHHIVANHFYTGRNAVLKRTNRVIGAGHLLEIAIEPVAAPVVQIIRLTIGARNPEHIAVSVAIVVDAVDIDIDIVLGRRNF